MHVRLAQGAQLRLNASAIQLLNNGALLNISGDGSSRVDLLGSSTVYAGLGNVAIE